MDRIKRDLDFLYEIASLRNVPRGWRQHLRIDCASVLEHTIRVVWLAVIISRMEKKGDENTIIKMALLHDLAEARTSDHSYVQKIYVQDDEASAAHDSLAGTSLEDLEPLVLQEYVKRETIEARIVKDADNLDIELELMELEEQGSKLPAKWKSKFRKMVKEEKLYTESAKNYGMKFITQTPQIGI